MKKGKSPEKVSKRQLELCNFLNNHKEGKVSYSNEELMEYMDYPNRKAVYRDLKSLESKGYIKIQTKTITPVSITNGTATQGIGKVRYLFFRPSKDGLRQYHSGVDIDQLSHCGHKYYTKSYYKEYKDNREWIIGPDHTLIRNK